MPTFSSTSRCYLVGWIAYALLAGPLMAATAQGADRLPASKILPQNTVVYVEVASVSELVAGFNESNFGRMIADPQIKPFVTHLYNAANELVTQVRDQVGLSVEEIARIPEGEIAFAVVPYEQPRTEDGRVRVRPEFVLMIDCGENIHNARKLVARLNEIAANDGNAPQEESFEGIELAVYPRGRRSPTLFEYENTYVMCSNLALAKDLIDRWTKGADDSLSQNASYGAIMNRCRGSKDESPHFAFFADPITAVREFSRGNATASLGLAFLPALGLDGFKGLGGSLVLSSEDFDAIIHMHLLIDSPRAGVLDAVALGSGDNTPPRWVPADAAGYLSLHWNAEETFAKATKLIDNFSFRQEGTTARDATLRIEEALGVDLEKDLLPAMTGRLVHVSWFPRPVQIDVGGLNLVGVQLKDAKKFQPTFDKVVSHLGSRFEKKAYAGVAYYEQAEEREPGDVRPTPSFCILDDWLVIVDRPAILKHVLARRDESSGRLADALDYKLVANKISRQPGGKSPVGIGFSRPEEGWKYLYDIATSQESRDKLRQRAEENPNPFFKALQVADEGLEKNPLPPFQVLARYIAPGGWVMVDDDSGIHFMQFSLRRK